MANDFLTGKTVLVTGSSRGLGRALVDAALDQGAQRVYAGARNPAAHPDARVVPLRLDITDVDQIELAAKAVEELDVLVNNAGAASYAEIDDREELDRMLAVNLYGPYDVSHAFRHHLTASRGTLVNVLSTTSVAAVPVLPAYSISKAAAYSFTQVLRALLAPKGVKVHAVLAGPLDTDMSQDLDIPKTAPDAVAAEILAAVVAGTEDVFPDPFAAALAAGWADAPVTLMQRAAAEMVAA
ncbi:NAD(P)-dependent dehydrogenase (short-subunit alcohol dehydrogenase family) [Catenulispora sp. MAP5-51]|uniref:SDR family NAD(P)-dependent oxidoreductase n=1 Tax=Catenulispora sp. MAP5-51 TaxID=3156298 RepID=UPI00351170B6